MFFDSARKPRPAGHRAPSRRVCRYAPSLSGSASALEDRVLKLASSPTMLAALGAIGQPAPIMPTTMFPTSPRP